MENIRKIFKLPLVQIFKLGKIKIKMAVAFENVEKDESVLNIPQIN